MTYSQSWPYSSNDPPEHKPYAIPSTNMGSTHMPTMAADPGTGFSQRPLPGVPQYTQRSADPYGQFVPSFPPPHAPPSQHPGPSAPAPPPPSMSQHHPSMSPSNPRKRRFSDSEDPGAPSMSQASHSMPFYTPGPSNLEMQQSAATPTPQARKKSRTNTPWTPAEEQRLKTMRDAGNSWSEIAKVRSLDSTRGCISFFPLLTDLNRLSHSGLKEASRNTGTRLDCLAEWISASFDP